MAAESGVAVRRVEGAGLSHLPRLDASLTNNLDEGASQA